MPGRDVEFASNGGKASGYLSVPASGKGPGIIVLQEWWGLNGHMRNLADRFAAEGFVALTPDLYHGTIATEPDEAGKLLMSLNIDRAARDMTGAANYLLEQECVTSAKVGIVGFCMGGALALYAASVEPASYAAVIDFYGGHPNVKPDLSRISAPILGIFAENDGHVTPEVARTLESNVRALGKSIEIHIYPGTQHAFFNDDRPEVYDQSAATDAWKRTLEFCRQHIK